MLACIHVAYVCMSVCVQALAYVGRPKTDDVHVFESTIDMECLGITVMQEVQNCTAAPPFRKAPRLEVWAPSMGP